ncbi:hypothetical protein D5086_019393 [Populus alba]|uniref:Uncharacterized protein n=1 Tax=Populus alba TaxID=43335 RepID=A0ACC4BH75_POPAL
MSCISIPKINNRIGQVYVNTVTHLKLGNPWLLVDLKSPSLVMRFSSFLNENAYQSCQKTGKRCYARFHCTTLFVSFWLDEAAASPLNQESGINLDSELSKKNSSNRNGNSSVADDWLTNEITASGNWVHYSYLNGAKGGTKITSRLLLVPVDGRQRTGRINGEVLEISEANSCTKNTEMMMDWQGQKQAELWMQILLLVFAAAALATGYIIGSFRMMMLIYAGGVVFTTLVTVPNWPFFNRHPLKWLDPSEAEKHPKPQKAVVSKTRRNRPRSRVTAAG